MTLLYAPTVEAHTLALDVDDADPVGEADGDADGDDDEDCRERRGPGRGQQRLGGQVTRSVQAVSPRSFYIWNGKLQRSNSFSGQRHPENNSLRWRCCCQ